MKRLDDFALDPFKLEINLANFNLPLTKKVCHSKLHLSSYHYPLANLSQVFMLKNYLMRLWLEPTFSVKKIFNVTQKTHMKYFALSWGKMKQLKYITTFTKEEKFQFLYLIEVWQNKPFVGHKNKSMLIGQSH